MSEEREECAKCNGDSIQFRGLGNDLQYRICEDWENPGHLTWEEIMDKKVELMGIARPSGRFG